MDYVEFVKANLRGVGQVMLQANALAGAFFLLGILVNSWVMFVGAVLGALAGTLAAIFMRYERKDIEDGLYGFNGALVGIAMFFFLVPDAAVLLLAIDGAIISTIIMKEMRARKMRPFTFPFVLSAWLMLAFAAASGGTAFADAPAAMLSDYLDIAPAVLASFGQVMFQGSAVVGVIFLAGLLAGGRHAAAFGILGALSGIACALVFGLPLGLANIGIYGYNGVLSGIALSGNKWGAAYWAVFAAALSTAITFAFQVEGVIALTAPFVFATWCALALKGKFETGG